MSVDYSCYAVLGCKIPIESLWFEAAVPSCDHDTTGHNFCSVCGIKAELIRVYAPVFENEYCNDVYEDGQGHIRSPFNYSFSVTTEYGIIEGICSTKYRQAYAGVVTSRGRCINIDEELIRAVTAALAEVNLLHEPFGMWAVEYISY